jgi:hypothetical protein
MLKPFEGYFEDKKQSVWGRVHYKNKGIIEHKNDDAGASGKDFIVVYFHPFTGVKSREWRQESDIKILPCDPWDDDYIEASRMMGGN